MKIAITGVHGFIGQKLTEFLGKKGHEIKGISRLLLCGNLEGLASELAGSDAVIHLAGAPVMQRWTKKNRRLIYNSRIITTWNLTKALNLLATDLKPKVFIAVSAVGIYAAGEAHDEQSLHLDGNFLGKVVIDWENASIDLDKSIRRIIFRTGIVLDKDAVMIRSLLPIFKIGLGGRMGKGNQPFPFIHIQDLLEVFSESIVDANYSGIYNLVAPEQVSNKSFTFLLSRKLQKPASLCVPRFILEAAYGKASTMLLESPAVVPARLLETGYHFQYPTLSGALDEILDPMKQPSNH